MYLNNYPNPFSEQTSFSFYLNNHSTVNLYVYNYSGQLVDIIHSGYLNAGEHRFNWNANHIPQGIYFLHTKADNQVFNNLKLIKID